MKTKQTEIGIIPEDWEVKRLGEIGRFSKGQAIKKDEANSGDIPCIRYGELYTKHDEVIRKCYSFISESIAKTSKILKKGDILFAGSGETKADIGKCASFVDDFEAYAGGDIVIMTPSNSNSVFLGYLLNSPLISKQKANKGQGDAVVHISASSLKLVQIPIPPFAEQKRIAEALSDMDALIANLDALIDKKRNLKQATMQTLLTPKDGWEVKKLGEVLKVKHGKTQHEILVVGGKYPILATGGEIGRTNSFLSDKPSVLIGRKGTIDAPQFMETPFWTIDTLFYTEISTKVLPKYIFYFFNMIDWYLYNEASGVPSLNAKTIENIEISVPPLNEQQSIAQILSDMDSELAGLEGKRAKYKTLKTGMMQELLTGRVRLV